MGWGVYWRVRSSNPFERERRGKRSQVENGNMIENGKENGKERY